MDRNNPSAGDSSSRTNACGGSRDSQKQSQDSVIRLRVMGGMFFSAIIILSVFGLAASKLAWYFTMLISILGGLIGMFFGMGIEWIRYRGEMEDLRGKLELERMMGEMRTRHRVREAVNDTKKEFGGFAIESSRAVANRVANRIIARHAGSLLNDEQREATLEEADQIVEEELTAFKDSLGDESEASEKS